jgi:aminoglycoside phosphotransferase (APT) family kinase protein
MKSKTKNLLSADMIKLLIKVNFGDTCQIGDVVELKGGMFNSAYLVSRISENDKIVLKVSVAPGTTLCTYEQDPMPTEVLVYKLIGEKTSIPTPRILAFDFSKKHISSNYFFMTALQGEVMHKVKKNISKENLDSIKTELASYFAQLHHIQGNYFGYFSEDEDHQFSTWSNAFLHMFGMILDDGRTHNVRLPYERIQKVLHNNKERLDYVKEPKLVDYDLWPGNIFIKKLNDKYVIEGIVDFERAFWGDPLADLSSAFLFIKDIRFDTVFWKAYTDAAEVPFQLTKDDKIRLLLYKLYIWTIMTVETFRYHALYGFIQKTMSKLSVMNCLNELEQLMSLG